jgi:hypothetical protein
MAKRGRAEGQNGRAYLGVGDDLDAEDVGKARAAVVAEGAKDEVLALLIEDEDAGEHGGGGEGVGEETGAAAGN